ncbi:class I SAM-dependent methyltransferase [Corynebacterium pygosceleis]|uniref:class I SAM-dependent methyltransferase n=1 Tax=Corynebacterium pygosceleis TaxID=2800406 RepID=UPI003AF10F12
MNRSKYFYRNTHDEANRLNSLATMYDPISIRLVSNLPDIKWGHSILDLGAATCSLRDPLTDLGLAYYGVDIHFPKKSQFITGEIRRHAIADVENLPIKSGTFHIIHARLTLSHCRDISNAISEIRRAIRQDGHLIVIELSHTSREPYSKAFDAYRQVMKTVVQDTSPYSQFNEPVFKLLKRDKLSSFRQVHHQIIPQISTCAEDPVRSIHRIQISDLTLKGLLDPKTGRRALKDISRNDPLISSSLEIGVYSPT